MVKIVYPISRYCPFKAIVFVWKILFVVEAVNDLNNRWFGARAVYAELSPVTDFREACCRQETHTGRPLLITSWAFFLPALFVPWYLCSFYLLHSFQFLSPHGTVVQCSSLLGGFWSRFCHFWDKVLIVRHIFCLSTRVHRAIKMFCQFLNFVVFTVYISESK
jgi:hypothetical protein